MERPSREQGDQLLWHWFVDFVGYSEILLHHSLAIFGSQPLLGFVLRFKVLPWLGSNLSSHLSRLHAAMLPCRVEPPAPVPTPRRALLLLPRRPCEDMGSFGQDY